MRTALCLLSIVLLSAPAAWACMPEDAGRSAEIALDNGETLDLAKLTERGTEGENYLIENPEKDEFFPSDEPVVVYRSHFDARAMVKVGFSPAEYDWRSVLIVLPEEIDPDAFDFASAMQEELTWLIQQGVIVGLEESDLPMITKDQGPADRFFTHGMVLSSQSCLAPDACVLCTGEAAYTQLPPELLDADSPTAVDEASWGGIKVMF